MGEVKIPPPWKPKWKPVETWIPPRREEERPQPQIEVPPPLPPEEPTIPTEEKQQRGAIRIGSDGNIEKL